MKTHPHLLPLALVAALALGLAACEKTLDVQEPAERELVLNAVPSAGRQAFVHFAYTRFFLDDNNDQPVPDAELTLRVGGTVVPIDSVRRSLYFFHHTLQEDDTLRLDILAAGRSVHAETYVPLFPDFVPGSAGDTVNAFYFPSETFNYVQALFTLRDHPDRDEYYNITVTVRDSGARFNEWTHQLDTVDTVTSARFFVFDSPEITSSNVASYSPLSGRLMFLDRNIDGQAYQVPLSILHLKDTTEVPPFKHQYRITVESVTPARFRYILSASSQGGLTSFFAEQGSVYSNIDGALGIFAGSAKREFVVDLDSIPTLPVAPAP